LTAPASRVGQRRAWRNGEELEATVITATSVSAHVLGAIAKHHRN
jgi:hypothetical protein